MFVITFVLKPYYFQAVIESFDARTRAVPFLAQTLLHQPASWPVGLYSGDNKDHLSLTTIAEWCFQLVVLPCIIEHFGPQRVFIRTPLQEL